MRAGTRLVLASVALLFWSLSALSAFAESRALIVTGLTGSSANAEEFQRLAGETKRLLAERGLPVAQIEVLSEKVTREAILQKLQAAATNSPADEFWLILYGYSGQAQGGIPAFQVSGPRLTATDLKTALAAIPGRQFIFIGTNESGGFLPLLQNERCSVLSATTGEGEGDQPRFPDAWINAFSENPHASFARIAARAAALVDEQYKTSNLAQSEHARLTDPSTERILEPPFGVDLVAKEEGFSAAAGSGATPDAANIKVKMRNPNADWEQQPATAETKKIVAEARALPNPEGHAALVIEQKLGFTVEQDRTTERATYYRVFVARDEAVEDWANQMLPQSAPAITSKLELARVIQPDGSATVYNPAKLLESTDPESGEASGSAMVFLPNARAGCVIEIGYRTRELLDATLPHVSESLRVQREVPVLKTSLEVRVPEKPVFRVVLNNVTATALESSEQGRHIYRWQLGLLPAAESLPGDPPWTQWLAWVGVSSLPSWDEFAAWYRRLAKGSDAIDDSVKKVAAELSEGAKTREEKIRRSFEFVSAIRYVAIEIGVQGFRPRTPAQVLANRYGDCKDKANLLGALLRIQGIDAQFVLLNRGSGTDVNFPSWQFNHAICYVPAAEKSEELWLDSTDSVTPFGFVPPGDFGRAGLVFSKDKAEFKTIGGQSHSISEVRDEWALEQDAQGSWQGTFHRAATGLADDGLRRTFRGLTPAQRALQLYRILNKLWPAGDFSGGKVSDVSSLRDAVELHAHVTAALDDLPGVDAPGLEIFSAPERNRPLLLNDGQPVTFAQTLRLHYATSAPEKIPAPSQMDVAGEKLSVRWERLDARTVQRVARLELVQTTIAPADYGPLRQAIRQWQREMAKLE